jgi:hypothetical protein
VSLPYRKVRAADIKGRAGDANGVLLYPDGAPRCRFLLVPGGDPGRVRRDLGKKGCGHVRKAFNGGMDYMGICSGCFLVGDQCFKMWPGRFSRVAPKVTGPPPDIVMLPFHPLALMRAAGPVLKRVPFTGGANRMTMSVPHTEYIGFWRNGGYKGMNGRCALMAYSPPGYGGGKLVVTPAHPEGSDQSFLRLMCDYAMRHGYALRRRRIQPGKPVEAVCGDRQNQYYEILLAKRARRLEVRLTKMNGRCELMVRHGEPPRYRSAGATVVRRAPARAASRDKRKSIPYPNTGVYFILVHGNHSMLNGARYTLSVSVEQDRQRQQKGRRLDQ